MVLVNGATGIGTGFSTSIPQYNPLHIIANLKRRIRGEKMEPMSPWYRGFRGEIFEQSGTYVLSVLEGGYLRAIANTRQRVTPRHDVPFFCGPAQDVVFHIQRKKTKGDTPAVTARVRWTFNTFKIIY